MALMSLESWAAKIGYVVESHNSCFYVHKEFEVSSFKCHSPADVVDFILGDLRKSCCEET